MDQIQTCFAWHDPQLGCPGSLAMSLARPKVKEDALGKTPVRGPCFPGSCTRPMKGMCQRAGTAELFFHSSSAQRRLETLSWAQLET